MLGFVPALSRNLHVHPVKKHQLQVLKLNVLDVVPSRTTKGRQPGQIQTAPQPASLQGGRALPGSLPQLDSCFLL